MTNQEFNHWITGYLSLTSELFLNTKQLMIIKNHIELVKAVEGELADGIRNFLKLIEDKIKNVDQLNIDELKSFGFFSIF